MLDKSNFHAWIAVADKILKPLGAINTFLYKLATFTWISKRFENNYRILQRIGIWRLLSHGECHNIEFILSHNLWNNKFITHNSLSIVYADLLSQGIKTVLDLCNPVGLLESFQSISQKFGLENTNFICWYASVQCIPREWKEFIRHTGNFPADNFSDFRHGVFISSFFTKFMIVLFEKPLSLQQLRRHFQESLTLVKNCGPKFTCYQVNVQLIPEQECSNTRS